MGYIAARGGTQAILNAEQLVEYMRLQGGSAPLQVTQIHDQMRAAVGRAMNEGALYAPHLAALALKQSEGDSIEASFLIRAYRSTLQRVMPTLPASGLEIRCMRRISASFKDIPGGQMLGPSQDYQIRMLNTLLNNETMHDVQRVMNGFDELASAGEPADTTAVGFFPKVAAYMREQGVIPTRRDDEGDEPFDITRTALTFPCPRSARLQSLAQGDTGCLLTYAYSSVRGYGDAHPTLAELRFGYMAIHVAHPITGEPITIGEIVVTECETVSKAHSVSGTQSKPTFQLGYGFTFGHCEVKAISMAILDSVLTQAKHHGLSGESGPAANEEFVLLHSDGIEASGFTAHYKLPHYVTFEADLKVLDRAVSHTQHNSLKIQARPHTDEENIS
jgi:alpha-D-ribose 1-methylphosphonate 5-triphosphate synthase subunit PhnI